MAPAINGRCAFEVFFFHILFRAKEKSENEIEAHIEAMLGYIGSECELQCMYRVVSLLECMTHE